MKTPSLHTLFFTVSLIATVFGSDCTEKCTSALASKSTATTTATTCPDLNPAPAGTAPKLVAPTAPKSVVTPAPHADAARPVRRALPAHLFM